jgi:predicted DNA-binding protein (UPF0251 family)
MCICTKYPFSRIGRTGRTGATAGMSPRLKKPRTCECVPRGGAFKPTGVPMRDMERVVIHRDELEALRLCDRDGLTQEEAGERMGVSRGTVQRILESARRKVAEALSECKAIVFEETVCDKKPVRHEGGMR